MGKEQVKNFLQFLLAFIEHKNIWSTYDEEADVLYIDFKKPSYADDSEMTEDDIKIRYEKNQTVGLTVLHAKIRKLVNFLKIIFLS